jgi:hypothetical protein
MTLLPVNPRENRGMTGKRGKMITVPVGRVSNFTDEFTSNNPTFSDYDGCFLRVNRSIGIEFLNQM